jgi:hypothetical protein
MSHNIAHGGQPLGGANIATRSRSGTSIGGGALGGVIGGLFSLGTGLLERSERQSQASRQRRRIRRHAAFARSQFETERQRFLGLSQIQAGTKFLQDRFSDPLGGGLGAEFENRIRAAQAIRGFGGSGGGGAGAAQEATFLTRIAEQQRRQLLPMLGIFEQQAAQLGQGAFNRAFAPANMLAGVPQPPTVGSVLGSTVQGILGGAQLGSQLFGSTTQRQAF